jgi:hypothetical protein
VLDVERRQRVMRFDAVRLAAHGVQQASLDGRRIRRRVLAGRGLTGVGVWRWRLRGCVGSSRQRRQH